MTAKGNKHYGYLLDNPQVNGRYENERDEGQPGNFTGMVQEDGFCIGDSQWLANVFDPAQQG
jgi:hypothetical protein